MIRRLVWFAAGAGLALWLWSKVRGSLRRATPEAVGHRVAESAIGVGESARDFIGRVRAAAAEREAELRGAFLGGAESDALGLTEPPTS
ncbi:hypothetical protein [uncultured Friedmanniella sp.]|uniref:hypothetical protein n=1 Tax=uncultured Friedmanniella sp. TaxID=335381 RepID=UPI0035C9A829